MRQAGVTVTGWLDRAAALAQLATLDLYLQTSRWEGLPVAVLEAMAAGLPVLATNVIGNRDLIQEGENGYLCSDAATFTQHLLHLAAEPATRQRLGATGRVFVTEYYALASMMQALYVAYQCTPAKEKS